jgi:hypothetical protein
MGLTSGVMTELCRIIRHLESGNGCWSFGYISAVDANGRTIWIADGHRGDGKRFVVRAEEKLTAFIELESAIRGRDFCS